MSDYLQAIATVLSLVNPAICGMLGHTESELLRKRFPQTVHEEDYATFQEQFAEVLAGRRQDIELEMRYVRKDGTTMWAHTTAVWQFDSENRPTYCIHLIQNINQRKYAINALHESRQKYEGLINTLEGIVWEANAETLEFSFVSPQAKQILGYPVDKWISQPRFWRNRIHTEDLDRVIEAYARGVESRGGFELEYRVIADDGHVVWLRDTVNVISGVGFIGSSFNRSASEQVERLSLGLEVSFIEGLPVRDIEARLKGQNPANSAILFLTYTVDTEGNSVTVSGKCSSLSR